MRLRLVLAALLVVCLGSTLWAAEPRFKSAEVKHFERSEGVELSPEFSDLLYAEIKNALKKSKLVAQPIGEGEVIDTADAPHSLIISGNVLEYKKGSVAKAVIIGFGVGRRNLRAQFSAKRMSDQQVLYDKEVTVKTDPRMKENILAKLLANKIVNELKNNVH